MADVVNETISSSFRTDQTATPVQSLASQHPLECITVFLVCTEEITDFTASNADITSWDIGIRANMTAQLPHEGNAELADFVI